LLKQRWKEGKPGFGMWADLGSPAVIEAMCELDLDFILLDGEHGISSYEGVLPMMQAMNGAKAAAIVRVPAGEYIPIKRVLDMGAEGILVPQVRTAEEVAKIVSLCRYAPQGIRGVGPYRASRYEMDFEDYFNRANEEIAVVVQIENNDAVKNLDAILAVKGLDGVFIGPADLASDMGHFPNIDAPAVQKAIEDILNRSRKAGLPVGYYCNNGEEARQFASRGFQMVSICNDMSVLSMGLRRQFRIAHGQKADEQQRVTS
jgi:2-keto-3-deoxy-L-rhamnonate aldolase RhmA